MSTIKTELADSTLAEVERACARARLLNAPDDAPLRVNLRLRGGRNGGSAVRSVVVEVPDNLTAP